MNVRLLRFLLFAFFIALSAFFSSCGEKVYFSNGKELANGVWTHEDVFVNSFHIGDKAARYHLILDIEHSRDYAFQNIYMNIYTQFPNDTVVTDMLSVDMADRAGQWQGNCKGSMCNLRVYLQQNIRFREMGNYTVEFEQFTRMEELSGIHSLEFKILPR